MDTARNSDDLVTTLRRRVDAAPERVAFTFYDEPSFTTPHTLTYGGLLEGACKVAGRLHRHKGERALLVFDLGLDFVQAFYGCLMAGVLPAPMPAPRMPRIAEFLQRVQERTEARFVLHDPAYAAQVPAHAEHITLAGLAPATVTEDPSEVAVLQFTSGSTQEPKGVMQTHANLLAAVAFVKHATGAREGSTGVLWLPPYHNAGLIYGIVNSVVNGMHAITFPTELFLKRPITWLEGISRFRAALSGAPNFAFDLAVARIQPEECEGLDLSSWEVAVNGSEPVSKRTLDNFSLRFAGAGFRAAAFHATYGLAEGTLVNAGTPRGAPPKTRRVLRQDLEEKGEVRIADAASSARTTWLVSSGVGSEGFEMRVVDAQTRRVLPELVVGEIWLRGSLVAKGYWNDPAATKETFDNYTADGAGPFLRSGDLGCWIEGELYVIGRMKDVIVMRGDKFHATDIERVVQAAYPLIAGVAAVSVNAHERDQLVILVEVMAQHPSFNTGSARAAVQEAVQRELQLSPDDIALLPPMTLPRTANGKLMRPACRAMYAAGQLVKVP